MYFQGSETCVIAIVAGNLEKGVQEDSFPIISLAVTQEKALFGYISGKAIADGSPDKVYKFLVSIKDFFQKNTPAGSFGFRISGAGDVSVPPDAVPDFLAEDPNEIGPSGLLGVVRAFSGADASIIYTWSTQTPGTRLYLGDGGQDVDGDGFPDIILLENPLPGGAPSPGTLTMISGATGQAIYSITGSTIQSLFSRGRFFLAPASLSAGVDTLRRRRVDRRLAATGPSGPASRAGRTSEAPSRTPPSRPGGVPRSGVMLAAGVPLAAATCCSTSPSCRRARALPTRTPLSTVGS